MNILILNGNPDQDNKDFDQYLLNYQIKLHKTGHYAKAYRLRDMRIGAIQESEMQDPSYLTLQGADDIRFIINSLEDCDLLVWASPLSQGALSLTTRTVQSRINRYFQHNSDNHSHPWHPGKAVQGNPLVGVIVQPQNDTTPKQMLRVRLTQERMAAELKTVMSFMITTENGPAGAVCETFRSLDYTRFIDSTCEDFLTHMAS